MVLPQELLRKMVAEAIGTFILVLAGTGAVIVGGSYALGFGFGLIVVVYAIGHVSGAHVNPAVSLGLAVIGRFPMAQVPYYVGSQIVGAVAASLFLRTIHGNENGLGTTSVAEGYSLFAGFLFELVATAVLVFVVVAVATDKRVEPASVGLAIGGALLFIELIAGPVTGGSVNPARSLGPAIVSWSFTDLWIYLTAPFIGGAIGAVAFEFIRGHDGWSSERKGVDGPPPDVRRPRTQQSAEDIQPAAPTRRPAPDVEQRPRRQPQARPPIEQDMPDAPQFDDDFLQPKPRSSRSVPRDFDDDLPPQRPPQRRRPPQQ